MNARELIDNVSDLGEEPLLLLDGFEDALLGYAYRFGGLMVSAYSWNKCIAILMSRDKMSMDEAQEYFEFNVEGAWHGDKTPVFVVTPE